MKKVLVFLVVLTLFNAGCRDAGNIIEIKNMANGVMILNFRGEVLDIASGASKQLSAVPNGTYDYATIVELPPGISKWEPHDGLSGTISLFNKQTTVSIVYTSVTQVDSITPAGDSTGTKKTYTKTYHAYAAVSSSHSALSNPVGE
jgi:hypothetical protein